MVVCLITLFTNVAGSRKRLDRCMLRSQAKLNGLRVGFERVVEGVSVCGCVDVWMCGCVGVGNWDSVIKLNDLMSWFWAYLGGYYCIIYRSRLIGDERYRL